MLEHQVDHPLPDAVPAFLGALQEHWRRRGGRIHVVPLTRGATAGFPCVEDPALVLAQRQDFRLAWPGGSATVREDGVAVVPADRPYRLEFDERRRRYPGLTISSAGGDVCLFMRNQPVERWHECNWRYASGTGTAVRALLDALVAVRETPEGPGDWIDGTGATLVVSILEAALAATDAPLRASRGGPAVAVRCRNHLREHLADPELSVPGMAAALGYDADWLGREFRRETGETIRQALNHLRVQRARELLRQRKLPIAEVATRCGFASASHFSRTFKQIEGNTARKYRKYGHLEEG